VTAAEEEQKKGGGGEDHRDCGNLKVTVLNKLNKPFFLLILREGSKERM
jgi:hypothetical protein